MHRRPPLSTVPPAHRNPLVIRLFLWKRLAKRRAIADDYRKRSGQAISEKTEAIRDVNADTVRRFMRKHGVTRLIHGHTRRPANHYFGYVCVKR